MKKKTAVAAVVMSTAVMLSGASALAEDAGRTVGINSWVAGAYALDILANNAQYAVEANGDETLVFNDEGNVEKLTSNVENMISANVDGLSGWECLKTCLQLDHLCWKMQEFHLLYTIKYQVTRV